jgi:TrpR family trp operon transcriptional repressor
MGSLKELAGIITKLKAPARIEALLQELLTPAEIQEINKRLAIFKMLQAGAPQREIAAKLHTSLCAVTRGSKELKKEKSIFREIFKK